MSDDQKNDPRFALVQQQQQGIIQTASAAASERARAEIIARFQFARLAPRSSDQAYATLIRECKRPSFARTARYGIPRAGKTVTGWTIRFMEAAARALGNIDVDASTTYEDDERRIVRVSVTDLESNTTCRADVVISKTMERRSLKDGEVPIGTRINSEGRAIYIVATSDGDLLQKQNALVSKATRTLISRHIPGDFLDDCMLEIERTIESEDARDPASARKALVLAFDSIGVSASALAQYLGCEVSAISPAQLGSLRKIYQAIRDGETTWREVAAQSDASANTEKKPTRTEKAKAAAERATKSAAVETTAEPATEPAPSAPAFDASTGEVEDEEAEEARARAIEARLKGEA